MGKERDSESSLDDFEARYYSSQYGRFMVPDWAAKATAVPYAVFGNPQTLNLYAIVHNDVENFTDLDGHRPCPLPAGCYAPDDANHKSEAQEAQNITYGGYSDKNTYYIATKTVNWSEDSNGTVTLTTTTTTASFSTASNDNGQFLGASTTQTSITTNLNTGDSTTTTSNQSLNYGGAARVFGGEAMGNAAAYAGRPDPVSGFLEAVGSDANQRRGTYAFYAVEAAAALTPLPEACAGFEGLKAGIDVVVGAAHLAWELTH
jgi:RHS repeat-associated protein